MNPKKVGVSHPTSNPPVPRRRRLASCARAAVGALLVTVGAPANAEPPPKPLPLDVGAGRIAWFDIATPNLARAKDFYAKLLGWSFEPVPGSDQAAEISIGGTSIGTLRVTEGKIGPFNGVVYVQVSDLVATCAKAKELGGTLLPGFPFDLPGGRGAIGLVLDPGGHPLGLYSRTPLPKASPSEK